MTCGGFSVGGVHVAGDLGFQVASRSLTPPAPKSVRKSIPFTDGSYDFSAAYGRVFFDDRELSYTFHVLEDGAPAAEAEVSRLIMFLSGVHDSDIHDDDSPFHHFRGSYAGSEVEWDEDGCAATVTATFAVHPWRISDDWCEARLEVGDNVVDNRGMPARITVVPDGTMTIQIGALKQTFTGETRADIALPSGESTVKVTAGGGIIRWREEVA